MQITINFEPAKREDLKLDGILDVLGGTSFLDVVKDLRAILDSIRKLREIEPGTEEAFKARLEILVNLAETIAAITRNQTDDAIVAVLNRLVENEKVVELLWRVFRRLQGNNVVDDATGDDWFDFERLTNAVNAVADEMHPEAVLQ